MAVLAMPAGAFIALGSVISLVAQSGAGDGTTPGPVLILSGLAFSVGLILVMVAGAELFTGKTMMVLPAVTGAPPAGRMIAAWKGVGEAARSVAGDKLAKSPIAVFCSGILANALVCLAVWMSMNANTLPARIVAIVGPITVFVAAGLDHSVANLSLIPMGWLSGMPDGVDWSLGLFKRSLAAFGMTIATGNCSPPNAFCVNSRF